MDDTRNERIGSLISSALRMYMDESPRSVQASEGILGPSDIGFCRQKATLMTKGVVATDHPPKWAAAVGTAVHNYVEAAIKEVYPDWLVGSIDKIKVTAVLPSGAEISGHPDIVVPSANAILDIKTVDGFEWIKREGTSKAHKYQRHLYAMGLIRAGVLTESDDTPVIVGNVYLDRSGKKPEPLVIAEPMDPTLTAEIDSWVQDVVYAVTNGEDASRDVPAAVCEKICSYFTVCRGALETFDGTQMIEDDTLLSAVDMYVEAREIKKEAEAQQKAAQAILNGINGSTGTYQVRWVDVQPTTVESFEKSGYTRMDVRKVRK